MSIIRSLCRLFLECCLEDEKGLWDDPWGPSPESSWLGALSTIILLNGVSKCTSLLEMGFASCLAQVVDQHPVASLLPMIRHNLSYSTDLARKNFASGCLCRNTELIHHCETDKEHQNGFVDGLQSLVKAITLAWNRNNSAIIKKTQDKLFENIHFKHSG